MVPLTMTNAARRAVTQLRTREETRERYGIRGNVFGDCFSLWCCRPCALTQERREIELEENSFY
jgi:Cys-rich protein (TIGR01571 family)